MCICIPIPKIDGGIRPIAMCEALLKLAELYALRVAAPRFHPSQYGCGVSRGCETMVHAIRKEFESGSTIVAFDCKNAFNCVDRGAVRRAAAKYAEFAALFNGAYAAPVRLRCACGDFDSVGGVRQGSPLAGTLFCLALDEVLLDLQEAFPGLRVWAYMDDLVISATSPIEARAATAFLRQALLKIGLHLRNDKCSVLNAQVVEKFGEWADFNLVQAVSILGSPIGHVDACKEIVKNKMKKHACIFDHLRKMGSCWESILLLTSCVKGRPEYLAHLTTTAGCISELQAWDRTLWDVFSELADADLGFGSSVVNGSASSTDESRVQTPPGLLILLSQKFGGAGLTPLSELQPALYAASLAGQSLTLVRHAWNEALAARIDDSSPTAKRIREMNITPKSLRWLESSRTKWRPDDFAGALRARWNLLPKGVNQECVSLPCSWCGNNFNKVEWCQHVISCNCAPRGASRNRKHYSVGVAMYEVIARHLPVIREPRDYQNDRQLGSTSTYSGADLKITVDGATVVLDFSVVHGAAPSSVEVPLTKLFDKVRARKNGTYLDHAKSAGHLFYPFPILSSCGIRRQESNLLKSILKDSGADLGDVLAALQVAVAKGNGRAVAFATRYLRQA